MLNVVKISVLLMVLGMLSCRKDVQDSSVMRATVQAATVNDVVETSPPVWTAINSAIHPNVSGYWRGLPARYSVTTKRYPLIIFIHGIGELGTGLSRVNCCGLPYHLSQKKFPANFYIGGVNYSFIVMAPQFRKRPTAVEVQAMIDYAKAHWRVDATRVYVTGLSMGGGCTFDWSAVYGQLAAAIVPVCAGTKPTVEMCTKIASKKLPMWGLYSTKDELVPVQWGKDFFSWIDAANPGGAAQTKLTIWTDATHVQTWARAFNPALRVDGYSIYQWMLLHHR
jgi:poly(3-hydroxybutyrate) depolymerase